jgi:hypothetical protein
MKEIGGYFELELNRTGEYHQDVIRLNTGRNAFEYILRARRYSKVFLPYYTSRVMLEPIQKLGLEYSLYQIDDQLFPKFDFSELCEKDVLVYTNYFGICDENVRRIAGANINLVIDNSQAFFATAVHNIDTFYSPRKFFGVPDGAYLFTNAAIPYEFEKDNSLERLSHLLTRIESSAELGFALFKSSESCLSNQPIRLMSEITRRLLMNIDYNTAGKKRLENFLFLHSKLSSYNLLNLDAENIGVPMVYPFRSKNFNLRNLLIENKIYVATYWKEVLEKTNEKMLEYSLVNEMVPLPVDQRYSVRDMETITTLILNKLHDERTGDN